MVNARAYVWLQGLILLCLISLPMLAPTIKRGANGPYHVLVLLAIVVGVLHFNQKQDVQKQKDASLYCSPGRLFYACMLCPMGAVLFSQVLLGDIHIRSWDAPSRFLMVIPIVWCLMRIPAKRLRHVQWGICLGAFGAVMTLMLADVETGLERPTGMFASPVTIGNMGVVLGICSLLALSWRLTRSPLEPMLKLLAGAAGIYASLLSQTRGGWLAIPILLLLMIWRFKVPPYLKFGTVVLGVVLMGAVYVGSHTVQIRIHEAHVEFVDGLTAQPTDPQAQTSVGLRVQFWRAAIDIFRQHPLTGIGGQNISAEFQRRADLNLMPQGMLGNFTQAHNNYLQALAAYGLPGLLACLAICLAPLCIFWRAFRSGDRDRVTAGSLGMALVLAFMIFSITNSPFVQTRLVSFYCGLLAVFIVLALPEKSVRT